MTEIYNLNSINSQISKFKSLKNYDVSNFSNVMQNVNTTLVLQIRVYFYDIVLQNTDVKYLNWAREHFKICVLRLALHMLDYGINRQSSVKTKDIQ